MERIQGAKSYLEEHPNVSALIVGGLGIAITAVASRIFSEYQRTLAIGGSLSALTSVATRIVVEKRSAQKNDPAPATPNPNEAADDEVVWRINADDTIVMGVLQRPPKPGKTKLILKDCEDTTDGVFDAFNHKNLQWVKTLTIENCPLITNEGVKKLQEIRPDITVLFTPVDEISEI